MTLHFLFHFAAFSIPYRGPSTPDLCYSLSEKREAK